MKKILVTGLWLLLFFCLPACAYEVEWQVFVTVGGEAKGGNWGVVSSMGQPICGVSQSAGGTYSCEGAYVSVVENIQFSLTAAAISSALVRLTWSDNLTDKKYYSLSRDGILLVPQISKDSTSYEDTSQLKADTQYQYLLTAYNANGALIATATVAATTSAFKERFIPYHNLFHPAKGEGEKVSICYKIDNSTHVSINLYNLAGEMVKALIDENKEAGQYWVDWEGKNDDGDLCAAGVYIIQIKTRGFTESKKIILIK